MLRWATGRPALAGALMPPQPASRDGALECLDGQPAGWPTLRGRIRRFMRVGRPLGIIPATKGKLPQSMILTPEPKRFDAGSPSPVCYYGRMNSKRTPVLLFGGCIFVVGAALLLLWLEGRSGVFLGVGLGLICISAPILTLAGLRGRSGANLLESRREQRLWRSGPLGRWWLGRRKRRP